ncbi:MULTISPECIES: methionyl-tRNA formyltransferase [Citromicrobium]|uniref:methionyl-tRNA formyltransferase n=1 Tax=Citromicrobium TaxID=72173 RepID=UPI0001DD1118|nr:MULTISPECIES: methionyl-tRNA formyltransferase [Citromicrobium]ALG60751.1 methionyl-tRNA formyltransferase [Citromicrobium sp. JL477]KPM14691.1 methionyl-tRNA formyltransferase [Citromicrobium sp. JL1351]KPM19991.1 methionyl-tRNA formyltransferase [Citromicrobium sp. JL31]KPM22947.1 methionyl-tRNA formyltransferase [Citromicrobium sp. JL2201]
MRIVFMGTPDFAVPTLEALVHAAHEVVCVYTQPPRKAGRGKKLQPTPVHQAAERLGIEVRHPASLKSQEEKDAFAALDADVGVVAAYGLILPQAVLDAPTHGCLNVHASILPRWRGAAPIQRAILAGDTGTGVTIMQMEAGLDTGPMLATIRTPIDRKTAGDLTDELAEKGAQLMIGTLRELSKHIPVMQDDAEATHAPKIDKAEARLDWTQDAVQVERQVRAFAPWPGAFFEYEGAEGMERVKTLAAEIAEGSGAPGTVLDDALTVACGSGALRLTRVQRAGKPAMDTADFQRGRAIGKGAKLGS